MKTAISKRILCVALAMVLCFAVIGAHGVTPAKAAGEDTITYDFSGVTLKGTQATTATLYEAFNTGKSIETDTRLTSVTACDRIYLGNGAGGAYPSQGGMLKTGASSKTGSMTLVFSQNVTKVEISCYAWSKTSTDKVSVNSGTAQSAPTGEDYGTLTFNIDANNTVSFAFTYRVFIKSITVTFEDSASINTDNVKVVWKTCSMVLDEKPEINYYLEVQNPDGCAITEYGYQIWDKASADEAKPEQGPSFETAPLKTGPFLTKNGQSYITEGGLNAYEITNRQWIRAYVVVGGEYIWSDIIEYSIYPYVNFVAGLDPNGTYGGYKTSELKATVKAFKEYGEAYATMWANKSVN